MTEGVIIAIITGLCAVFGQWLITRKGRIDDAAERARLDERTAQRLLAIEHSIDRLEHTTGELQAQVREHNGLKQDIAALRADVANLKER